MQRIIDLTLTLRRGMRGVDYEPKFTLEREGWNARTLHLYSHCGTHMDAPLHFVANGATIDQLPIDQCVSTAWIVDLPNTAPRALIEVSQLGDVRDRLESGESLLLRTGWSEYVDQSEIYRDQLPRISAELARWCVEKNVRMLGVEPPSVADVNNLEEVTFIHRILLDGGVTIVEGLTNLDSITERKVLFVAAPLKIENGDGAPCRAFAVQGTRMTNDNW